ncbi:TetR/AcrR family transcriptional regulator [Pseudonocardia eucalypti]|uniref:TetR/AcrR family transcriptional regulator n=1 Tax=Pseudonocardia eucalypti TaxID=648755 RepID=A0ABP9Q6W4_9PSEU|nr:AcrR family transcriptional regulator [Pseudonocardia eucalypti]
MSVLAEGELTAKGRATRARLLDCARAEAIAGDGHLELATVAKAAGVAPSLVHRYFGSKAGLVSALVNDYFDRYHAEVLDENMDDEGDWATHERVRLERGVAFHYADPFTAVLYGRLGREAEVARTEAARISSVVELAARSIRRAQAKGELPAEVDPMLAGAAMFGAIQRVMVEAVRREKPPPPELVVDVLWRQVAASVNIAP